MSHWRWVFACLALALFGATSACAQVKVEISFERPDYLLFESVEAKVRVSNLMGEPLDMARMSGGKPWLNFYITTSDDDQINRTEKEWKSPAMTLLPGEVKSLSINLMPWFLIRDTGDYRVVAEVTNRGNTYASRPAKFNVVNGPSIWSQEYTAPPDPKDPAKAMRPRFYSLHLHKIKEGHQLYLRIQNPEAHRVYCTLSLGDIVNYGDPKARIDRMGNIHVMQQSGTRIFTYNEYSPMGKRLQTRFFSNVSSPPTMVASSDDETMIVGGEELFEKDNEVNSTVPTAPVGRAPSEESK